ncbi:16S rRNA (guanine(527)-N(7))-methyltransferase RsmG [Ferrovibrio sp.]|uniref:16S rRNA (guanine(527)-N(7))-methyltransferase RsmG n=1 Tax=Ferrovibrio sp. TaxID=1917215 RepID=UPI001B5FA80F|nr:16S rRNA (guanine(527)-N(7))-methyltransferase RsmG [Ferrovibrio sp.]MBP7062982.1 16S rRNA (guanine(527)-N(7))-methyltransferase RsmG [Ferrovibrio sp.]
MTPHEFQQATGCDAAALARLQIYAAQLVKWQKAINLVAPNTLPDLWRRHFLDSAQLLPLAEPVAGQPGIWLDLGAGGGFPGLVLAAMLPGRAFVLVESDTRKAVFLRETARAMDVPVTVLSQRIEAVSRETLLPRVAVISARALAPLAELLAWSARFADTDTMLLFPKGRQAEDELTLAGKSWTMQRLDSLPSQTDQAARIIRIMGLEAK